MSIAFGFYGTAKPERAIHLMFTRTAEYYDAIYSSKNYAAETEMIRQIIARKCPGAKTILDVACGTAEHAKFLALDFEINGIDIEPKFIEIARAKIPAGTFSIGDMRSFQLSKRYDVVQCLFSAIGYLLSADDIVAALKCFRDHLAPGGVVLVEPWIASADYKLGHLHNSIDVDRPDLKICRMGVSGKDGDVAVLELHYLIARSDGVRHEKEMHRLLLTSPEQMVSYFAAAGLRCEFDPVGLIGSNSGTRTFTQRGLFIAQTAHEA